MRYSPDGRLILTGCWSWQPKELEARLWESSTGKLIRSFKHSSGVGMAVFSPNAARVATASEDMTARVWETSTARPLSSPLLHASTVRYVVFSPDGRWLATGCRDGTVYLWDWAVGERLKLPYDSEEATEQAIQFLGDSSVLLIYPWKAAHNRPFSGKLVKLPDYNGSAEDWICLAGFVSGDEVDEQGALVPLAPDTLRNSFARLRLRLPAYVSP
jgi:WD40 repeat protein